MSRVHLITFADGGQGYLAGRDLLVHTAKESGWFDSITTYDQKRLTLETPTWHETHKAFINSNKRGFGYWIWKPHVIAQRLSQLPDDDVLLYLDAGCQINKKGEKRFSVYLDLTANFDMLCFYLHGPNYTIKQWTKGDLLTYFEINPSDPILELPQIESGICFYKKSSITAHFLKMWSTIIESNQYKYVNDEPSIITNSKHFLEHRHDQATLTLLHYRYRWGKSIRNENYFPNHWNRLEHPNAYPIAATRFVNEKRTNLMKITNKFFRISP
jgi:hypothetical protein